MSLWSRSYSLRAMMMIGIVVFLSLSVVGVIIKGWGPMYDGVTLALTMLVCALFIIVIMKCDSRMFPMVMVLETYFIIMIFPRLLSYLWFPDIIKLPSLYGAIADASMMTEAELLSVTLGIGLNDLNWAIGYIFTGTLLLMLGFFMATKLFGENISPTACVDHSTACYTPRSLLITMVVFAGVHLYLTVWLGNSVFSNVLFALDHKALGVLTMLVHPGTVFLLGLVSLFIASKSGRKVSWCFIAMLFILVVSSALDGSRSVPMALIQYVLVALIAVFGNYRTVPARYAGFFVMISVTIVVAWPLASAIRDSAIQERNQVHSFQEEQHGTIVSSIGHYDKINITLAAGRVVNRLVDLDYAIVPIVVEGDSELLSKYMTVLYAVKSAINILVPGEVFEGVEVNTAFLWPFIYGERDTTLLKDKRYYETLPWTVWGLAHVMFGGMGGLVALFFIGFALQGVFILLGYIGGRYSPYLLTVWLVLAFSFFGNMGLDDWLMTVKGRIIDILVIFVVLELLMKIPVIGCRLDGGTVWKQRPH